MPVRFDAETAYFEGECMVEEALPLVEYLREHDRTKIDMKTCTYVHTAVLQVLSAYGPGKFFLPDSRQLAAAINAVVTAKHAPSV